MAKRTIPPRDLEQQLLDRLALLNQKTAKRPRRAGSRGRARVRVAGLLGVFALLALGASGAFAVHDEGFQLEGNATAADLHHGTVCVDVDNNKLTPCVTVAAGNLTGAFAGPYDWDSLFDIQPGAAPGNALGTVSGPKAVLPGGFTGADFQKDFGNTGTTFLTGDDTTFATGSKDTLDINPNPGGWQCNHDNNVNSKVDIINGFAATAEVGGDQLFYFGLEKDVDNGDNNVGMWLFQDPTVGCSSASGTANFSGHHVVGDLLVVSAFTNGGGVSNIDVYEWVGGQNPLSKLASGVDCLVTGGLDSVCATVFEPNDPTSHNQNKLTMPWLSADNSVVNAPHPSPNFYEGGINLSAFPQFADRCFTSYLLDTRSSQSPTSTLFDFVQGSIGTCNPAMTITKVATPTDVCAGANTLVTYDYTVENTGNIDLTNVDVSDDTIPGAQAAFELANGGSDDLAVGASVSFSLTANINATTTNIVTVDADSRAGENTASDTATATVTAHDCTISVTKSNSGDVCTGGTVTYTITVTNNSDLYDWTGDVTDDVLGTLATGVTIAAGDSVTYNPTDTPSGTVTNTATASGTFNDGSSTTASASDSSSVTAHDCSITVTKSNPDDVCDGGQVTYDYTITNNSDQFTWTGTLVDDQLGDVGGGTITLAPQGTQSFSANANITGTVTNVVTGSGTFDDPDTSSASDTDTATVSSHDCSITITKTPSLTQVCNGDTVSYSYTVTNNSDVFDWTGDVVDDAGTPADPSDDVTLASNVTIAAGDTANYTLNNVVINGTVTNTVTATGAFNDPESTSASDTATATVVGQNCGGGCTPGFWQGGLGVTLWNQINDPDWVSHGGAGFNPFVTTDTFTSFFLSSGNTTVDNMTMLQIVGSGGTNSWPRKAARDLIAAYLNASFGSLNYPYSTATILADWATAVAGGNAGFQAFHLKYSVANQLGCTIS